ncbi:MAG TPA: hypothetical protein VI454_07695 [Verrucomicrobiae bacterium]|jgi:hypothetical protein
MNKTILSALTLAALLGNAAALDYKAVPDWAKLPADRPQIGPMHGDVAVSSKGDVYVSVMDSKDLKGGVQVYAPDGKFLRNVPNAPSDLHGFVIHKEKGGEFIYGARLGAGNILKLTLDGKEVLNIPPSAISDEFKNKGKDGKPTLRLTAMDVAPNGDLFVTDGYSSDYVHHFDKNGKYLKSFGGKKEPYGFKTLHKIAIDTRFSPPRIIGCDRANLRVIHMSLDGEFLGVIAKDMLLPAAVAIHGDYAAIGEIKGQITILDKTGKVVAKFGTNTHEDEVGTNKTEPAKWRPGIVTAPHGVAFNEHGDVFASEYTLFGRVHRFNRQ